MATHYEVSYYAEHMDICPSLFRGGENLDTVLESIFSAYQLQQVDFLWLAENILNIDEATGWHLDFIGNIVGQDRFLLDFNTEPYFGFDRSYQSETFGTSSDPSVGGYWNSRSYFNTSSARRLNDGEYRRIIKARAIYNSSNCTTNDLVEVINLLTDRTDNIVQRKGHGIIEVQTNDTTGILAYFVEKPEGLDNILPVAAGVRIQFAESL